MNIVVINGSPRKNGATAKILKAIAEELSSLGGTYIDFVNVQELNFKYCTGCCRCYQTGTCFMEDDAEILSRKLALADGIVIGSPVYTGNVSGQLKTLIDRGHFVVEQLLKGKQALAVVTFENADGKGAMKHLQKTLLYSGAAVRGALIVKVPFNSNPMDMERNTRWVSRYSRSLHNAIKNNKKPVLFQRLVQKAVFGIGIKPFVLEKRDEYAGVLLHWQRRGISFEKI